ncbi:MAG: histidine kinase [Clostridium sp.]
MENIKLLTVRELAARWNCNERTIRAYLEDKTLTPCKNVPGVKFHPQYIAKLEGIELDRFSPIERRKMQREIDELQHLVKMQSEQLRKVAMLGTESMVLLQKIM